MEFKDLKNQPLYDVRIGVMFYFYQNPNKCKRIIKELFTDFCELTHPNFKYYSYSTAILKKLNMDGIEYFNKTIDESDFDTTLSLSLTDATKDTLQNVKIQFMLENIREEYPCKMPNRMYFECTPEIYWEELVHFIRRSFYSMTYHYVCCNYVMGINDHLLPKSVSQAAKVLRTTNTINDRYSILYNPYFLREINKGIDGPNLIQVLSEKIYDKIGFDAIMDANEKGHLTYELGEDYIMLNLLQDKWPENDEELLERYKKLYKLLKPIVVDIKKPQMYWKPDEWEKWRKRFE
ncbi:hypothetical protein [Clostridium sp. DJ247]|uniref:hypothetical protein n=1 Tax=Clostridium sp. DJ247 TaxID=2726188 RepID=UPI00162678EF|nr:hypothetical protein [Clostridium sp. DJ247]MBC2582564.1 hypothetical protein [Clostridium sp. DJ247]